MERTTNNSAGPAVLILAGGAGTRLWPLSTDDKPKQFLTIFHGRSLLQLTFERLRQLATPDRIFVSTNERYFGKIEEQLPELPPQNILVEPARRNTAPAIAICCAEISRRFGEDTVVAIFPSDHAIEKPDTFLQAVRNGVEYAATHDSIVTVAIEATEPNTSFGYLELGVPVTDRVVRLIRFVEKPPLERAKEFLRAGNFAWNGGMFIFRLSWFDTLLEKLTPQIRRLASDYVTTSTADDRRSIYEQMPSTSIDYAVMEKAPNVTAVRGDFEWSDVGSWKAIVDLLRDDNAAATLRSERTFALSESGKKIAIVGVSDVAVVESPRGILVLNLRDDEGLSQFIQELES